MEKGYFITGTDTNVGKTWATVALMRYFKSQGKSVIGMKPVASGCNLKDGLLVNDDALLLQENASIKLDYSLINPYAFELPVSPHIAGKNNPVEFEVITANFDAVKSHAQIILVEGAGGWYSPLNENQDNRDLAVHLGLPVILVVAIKLGCINHSKLTYKAISDSDVDFAGWIAVCINPNELCTDENIATIKAQMDIPMLATLPYINRPDFNGLAKYFSALTTDSGSINSL
jgi:dethiobiotin synthetase